MTVAPKPKNYLSSPYRKFSNFSQRGWQGTTGLQKRCKDMGEQKKALAHHCTVWKWKQWDSADKNKTVFIYNATNSRNITWCVSLPPKATGHDGPRWCQGRRFAAAGQSRIHGSPLTGAVNKPREPVVRWWYVCLVTISIIIWPFLQPHELWPWHSLCP